jgi:uncharacterized YccA/Bax inhibitor family protein
MNSSNPVLRDSTFRGIGISRGDTMTINGVITKSLILLLLLMIPFMYTWNLVLDDKIDQASGLVMIGGIGGLIMSLIVSFKPTFAPIGAPIFALLEGLALGGVSALYQGTYNDIVQQALFGTLCVFATMLILFRTRVITVTDKFRAVVSMSMMAIFLVYLLTFVLSFFGSTVPYIHESGTIGIAFSVIVIVVASLMLMVDFDMIERGAAQGAPKYMEWYGGFALLVTLIWIYIEFLRLLAKLRDNR